MKSTPAEIGARIKQARKSAQLSQTELAARLHKTMRTIQKYESGEIEPSISMINSIAYILRVSPAELIGYSKQQIQLNTLADVLCAINEIDKKIGLHFDIDVKRPPNYGKWSCALCFDGNYYCDDANVNYNADLCQFLERYYNKREQVKNYEIDQGLFDQWLDEELAYYANAYLENKERIEMTTEERLQRRNELDRQKLEVSQKDIEENQDQ
ncbi:MAG: helix-turn-helix transcriptional regulator [Eubacteriales bacterium]|nr:helix-turn-helix transcriptional regulator [Eubacteriales bacterium]